MDQSTRNTDINYIEMGMRIRQLRINNNYTVEGLAETMGVSSRVIYKWQNGESIPTVEHLFFMGKLFHTTIEFILVGNLR